MARDTMRLIPPAEDIDVVVANSRIQEEEIQVFTYPGPTSATKSPVWFPKKTAVLTSWYVVSSTVGTKDLQVTLNIGDMLYNVDGVPLGLAILPAASRVTSGTITYGAQVYNNPTISKDRWMSISLSDATDHSDIVVQIYGKYL